MDSDKVFLDSKYVSNLIKKYKSKNKLSGTIAIVLAIIIIALATFSIFQNIENNRYKEYIDHKIDTSIDTILKETVKIKYSLNSIIDKTNVENSLQNILLSSSKSIDIYKDLNNVMLTAMNDVAPSKIINVTTDLYDTIRTIDSEFQRSHSLNDNHLVLITQFNRFYNEMVYIQSGLVINNLSKSTYNNNKLLDIDLSNIKKIEESYQNKYNDGINYTMEQRDWINIMVKIESFIVNNK